MYVQFLARKGKLRLYLTKRLIATRFAKEILSQIMNSVVHRHVAVWLNASLRESKESLFGRPATSGMILRLRDTLLPKHKKLNKVFPSFLKLPEEKKEYHDHVFWIENVIFYAAGTVLYFATVVVLILAGQNVSIRFSTMNDLVWGLFFASHLFEQVLNWADYLIDRLKLREKTLWPLLVRFDHLLFILQPVGDRAPPMNLVLSGIISGLGIYLGYRDLHFWSLFGLTLFGVFFSHWLLNKIFRSKCTRPYSSSNQEEFLSVINYGWTKNSRLMEAFQQIENLHVAIGMKNGGKPYWPSFRKDRDDMARLSILEKMARIKNPRYHIEYSSSVDENGNEAVVGYIVYELIAGSKKGSRRLNVNLLAVHPDHHRRGIGQSLMKKAFEFADKNGITLVTLRCYQMNEFANKFYQALPTGDKLGDMVEPLERTDSTRIPQDKHDMYTYVFSLKGPATGSSECLGPAIATSHQTN